MPWMEAESAIKPLAEITDLGRRYAELPSDSAEKEALLLELCQCFHPYLMKCLVMICRGHVPAIGRGDQGAPINKDIKPFLLYFLPKGCCDDSHTMNVIVKGFHLAFKGMETEEIYDILMGVVGFLTATISSIRAVDRKTRSPRQRISPLLRTLRAAHSAG